MCLMLVFALGVGAGAYAVGAYAAGKTGHDSSSTNPCATVVTSTRTNVTTTTIPVTTTTTTPLVTTITTPVSTTTPTGTSTTPTGTSTTPTDTTTTPAYTTTTLTTYATSTIRTYTTTTATRTKTTTAPVDEKFWPIPAKAKVVTREPGKTVVAETVLNGPARSSPDAHAAIITKLLYYTPDQQALQTYLVIASERVHHETWLEIALAMRPNGRIGWVPRSYLGAYITNDTQLIVNRSVHSLVLCRAGRVEYRAPVGNGEPTTPTPAGHFWITESFPSDITFYGPWALGTSDYAHDTDFADGSIVGIHGTDAPQLIPGHPSHGCVRLRDRDILRLRKLVPIGTGLWIQ
jgi:hypothetical protein